MNPTKKISNPILYTLRETKKIEKRFSVNET